MTPPGYGIFRDCYGLQRLVLMLLVILDDAPNLIHAQDCDLACENNGVCVLGVADYSSHPQLPSDPSLPLPFHEFPTSANGYHCECPPGYTGLRCQVRYTQCAEGGLENLCYHGGACIVGLEDIIQSESLYYCDCNSAVDTGGTEYVGKHCELAKSQGEVCVVMEGEPVIACLNGGTCNPGDIRSPCSCTGVFHGRYCEYADQTVPTCFLTCENGGTCRLGFKDEASPFVDALGTNMDFMHCDCDDGLFGVTCEVAGEACGADDPNYCLYGSTCAEIAGKDGQEFSDICDCSTAEGDFSGLSCQYPATVYCHDGLTPNGQQFCVNEGVCRSNGAIGCNCLPDYAGFICQYRIDDFDSVPDCTLDCQNGGFCALGRKDTSFFEPFLPELQDFVDSRGTDLFEHCLCPDGYAGLTCETPLNLCGDNTDWLCLNGGICASLGGMGDGFDCRCPVEWEGTHCEVSRLLSTEQPSWEPTRSPSQPTVQPSVALTAVPVPPPTTVQPSAEPTEMVRPPPTTIRPSTEPTAMLAPQSTTMPPSAEPMPTTTTPSVVPSQEPATVAPSATPLSTPTFNPSGVPSNAPSSVPSTSPTDQPSNLPSTTPSGSPTTSPAPTNEPSIVPSSFPTTSMAPSSLPSASPSLRPTTSVSPSDVPSLRPSVSPTSSMAPTALHSIEPSALSSSTPSSIAPVSTSPLPTTSGGDRILVGYQAVFYNVVVLAVVSFGT